MIAGAAPRRAPAASSDSGAALARPDCGVARRSLSLVASCMLACAGSAALAQQALQPLEGSASEPPAPWHVVGLPQQTKPFTQFGVVEVEGRRALRIEADASYGNLVHALAPQAGRHLAWQWRLDRPLADSDLRAKSGDDTAVKVCVFFDEPMDKLSFADRQLLKLARARSADPVPAATLCYVWDARLAAGTALDNAFTRRLRYIVLESGTEKQGRWVPERRDLVADFARTFGAECEVVPPIVGVAVGADADNTRGHSIAYVRQLVLEP